MNYLKSILNLIWTGLNNYLQMLDNLKHPFFPAF